MSLKLWTMTLTAALLIALAVSDLPARANEQLKGNQIRKLLPGAYTLVIFGFDIGVKATTSGNLSLTFLGDELNGKWSVKGDQLCITLIEKQQSETACSIIHYDGKKFFSASGLRFYGK